MMLVGVGSYIRSLSRSGGIPTQPCQSIESVVRVDRGDSKVTRTPELFRARSLLGRHVLLRTVAHARSPPSPFSGYLTVDRLSIL